MDTSPSQPGDVASRAVEQEAAVRTHHTFDDSELYAEVLTDYGCRHAVVDNLLFIWMIVFRPCASPFVFVGDFYPARLIFTPL